MPTTRRSQGGGASLFGHFQPTKKSSAPLASLRDVKGKGKVVASQARPATQHPIKATEAFPAPATPSQSIQPPASTATQNDAPSSSSSSSPSSTVQATLPQRPRTPSNSPPPPLFEATHKSPLSVRQDPDKGKFFLMISPGKRSPAVNTDAAVETQPVRPSSPFVDRTPVKEDAKDNREPPSAPKKRKHTIADLARLREEAQQTPSAQDKRRPSYIALGASQEGGLSLLEESQTATPVKRPRTASRPIRGLFDEDEDEEDSDELLITPKKVREQPLGVIPPSWAAPTKAATFDDPFSPQQSRLKPTLSAGIFSTLAKSPRLAQSPKKPLTPKFSQGLEDDNPFLDRSPGGTLPARVSAGNDRIEAVHFHPIPRLVYSTSPALPLPPHYNALYLLHSAIEHSLVVHLATSGAANSTLDSTLSDTTGETTVKLPNLITFTSLRPLVERTAGRRLGSIEFARLMYIWSSGRVPSDVVAGGTAPTSDPAANLHEPLAGLGFLIGRQRALDSHGRKKWDWCLGIELTLKRQRREVTPPMQVSFGSPSAANSVDMQIPTTPPRKFTAVFGLDTPPCTPPSGRRSREASAGSSSSPALLSSPSFSRSNTRAEVGREGMSIVALWSNGIEERKAEVGRRLRTLCAASMEDWIRQRGGDIAKKQDEIQRPTTPEPMERRAEIGAGGLLTPSATRPDGRRKRIVHFDDTTMRGLATGSDTDASSAKQTVPEVWTPPYRGGLLTSWHPEWPFREAKAVPCAILPSLKDVETKAHIIGSAARKAQEAKEQQDRLAAAALHSAEGNAAASPSSSSSPSNSRAQSLMDRIKAKEASKRSSLSARAGLSRSSSSSSLGGGATSDDHLPSKESTMASFKRRAALSRLNDVAINLHMLFVSASSSSGNIGRYPILPLPSALSSITRSSKVTLSGSEAREAVELLRELVPGFVEVKSVGGEEWITMAAGGAGLSEVRRRVKEELDR